MRRHIVGGIVWERVQVWVEGGRKDDKSALDDVVALIEHLQQGHLTQRS